MESNEFFTLLSGSVHRHRLMMKYDKVKINKKRKRIRKVLIFCVIVLFRITTMAKGVSERRKNF
jgi:hypothetical protein